MKSLLLVLCCYVAHSAGIADESDKHLEKFYDINMEVLVLGEITAAPRIILKVGGGGSIELSSENDNVRLKLTT